MILYESRVVVQRKNFVVSVFFFQNEFRQKQFIIILCGLQPDTISSLFELIVCRLEGCILFTRPMLLTLRLHNFKLKMLTFKNVFQLINAPRSSHVDKQSPWVSSIQKEHEGKKTRAYWSGSEKPSLFPPYFYPRQFNFWPAP